MKQQLSRIYVLKETEEKNQFFGLERKMSLSLSSDIDWPSLFFSHMNLQLYIVKLTLSFKGPLKVERSSHMNNEHECPSKNLNIPPMITTQGFHDRN